MRGPTECWPWTRYRNPDGYGEISNTGGTKYAHRVAWELANGPIPDGLTVDHTCFNPPCQNPAHMELVPSSVNVKRKRNAAQQTCHRGHSLADAYVSKAGRRNCRTCVRLRKGV